jgi:tetratricopeptide (TPR) repeat protein
LAPAAFTGLLVALLLLITWYTIYSSNRDLVRARAWRDLVRRAAPFIVLILMALSLLALQQVTQDDTVMIVWLTIFAILVATSSFLAVPAEERKANRAFRRGDFDEAVRLYRQLSQKSPLARNYAFLGAALGASEKFDESIEASTKAIETDPEYGLAYYNRALVLLRLKKKSRARKDFQKAGEADIPRRFRRAVRKHLEDLQK